jgi:uncharacterized protein Yka (UPF0111/DUF47 family)
MDKLAENATNCYNATMEYFEKWRKDSYFHSEKYCPEPYKLLRTADKLQNRIIAIGKAEITRCVTIFVICGEIMKLIS